MVDLESVETYKPSGKCTPKGMATVIGLGLGGTMLACLLIYLVWRVIPYLGIVFAALLGLSVGVSVLFGVRLGKCRLPLAAGTVGLALGLSGYMGLHYMNFCSIVQSWRTSAERQLGDASRDGDLVTACVREQLTEEWGGAGFGAYVRSWRKGTWRSSWVIVLMQALWAVELIVVGALAAGIPFLASQDPFCEPCGRWCDHEQLLVASLDAREEVLGACRPETIGKLNEIETVSENLSRCVVELAYCSACKRTGFVTVRTFEESGADGTRESVILSEAVVSGEHVAALLPEEGAEGQSHSEEKTLEGNIRASDDADGGEDASSAQEASEAEKVGEHITSEDALQDPKKDGLNNGEM